MKQDYANKAKKRKSCATKFNQIKIKQIKLTWLERIFAFYNQIGDPE